MMATFNVTLADLEAALARQNAEAVRALRAAAADAGWDGHSDDFPAMLQAIRARGRADGLEVARAAVARQVTRWISFYTASTEKRDQEVAAALMRTLRIMREDIEKGMTWADCPDATGLWWFQQNNGRISLVRVGRDGGFETLSGEKAEPESKGKWSAVVEPVGA